MVFPAAAPAAQADKVFARMTPLPPMPVPVDNPQTSAKIRLGKQLYFDKRLSQDSTISCASCHDPAHGWADPEATSAGVGGVRGARNSPTVLNAGYNRFQFWDGRSPTLEDQAVGPIQNPVEMQMTMTLALSRLNGIPGYVEAFKAVFGGEPTKKTIGKAIASFERTVVSANSALDRYTAGDKAAMGEAAVRGMSVFGGKGRCVKCHSGPNFTDNGFHNVGIGMTAKEPDVGRSKITHRTGDYGAFKTPSLRSVALNDPYMHDGSIATLEAVVDHYDRGGEPNPHLDRQLRPLHLTASEKADLVEFLKALTGKDLGIAVPELPK